MAEIIKMPKMSDTMTEGTIASWVKKVGDKVKAGDVLAEVETDKATMELESYENGTLLYIGVKEKASVPVDAIIAIIGKEGEDISTLIGDNATLEPKKETTPVDAAPLSDTSGIEATVIRMPKMSDTMTEGVIAAWVKKVGDKVKAGDVLAEVETDKATMELESYEDGVLLYIGVEAGKAVPVDGIIAVVGKEGADYTPLLSSSPKKNDQPAKTENKQAETTLASASISSVTVAAGSSDSRTKISPLAKKLAQEKGIDVKAVVGSGENGRIVKRDVESFSPAAVKTTASNASISTTTVSGIESFEEVSVNNMRKTIARRLSESLFTAPHFSLTIDVDMDKAIDARKSMNDYAEAKISFNDIVIKAVAIAIHKHPKVNGQWLGDKIRYNHHVHIGVAVAVEDGLIVPVVRFADTLSLTQISTSVKELGSKA
ncbi:MAG TPA: pyruvate dehydrogenase, partial [Cytophagales bacterium]|nr:pyruvate dehydrogenase [Cytophagales bacterium]